MTILRKYKWTWMLLGAALLLSAYLAISTFAFGEEEELPVISEVEDFSFENVDGSTVNLSDTEGKVRLVYFFFSSCPDVCPVSTFVLSQVQERLKERGLFGTDASLVSISFDPANDTREKLREFSGRFKADYSGWYFLRGDQEQVRKLAEQSFKVMIAGTTPDDFAHADLIGLVDRDNRLRALYNPGDTENITPDFLADQVERLAKQ